MDEHNRRQLPQGAPASQQAVQVHNHVHHHAEERGRGQHVRLYGVGRNKRQLLSGAKNRRSRTCFPVHILCRCRSPSFNEKLLSPSNNRRPIMSSRSSDFTLFAVPSFSSLPPCSSLSPRFCASAMLPLRYRCPTAVLPLYYCCTTDCTTTALPLQYGLHCGLHHRCTTAALPMHDRSFLDRCRGRIKTCTASSRSMAARFTSTQPTNWNLEKLTAGAI